MAHLGDNSNDNNYNNNSYISNITNSGSMRSANDRRGAVGGRRSRRNRSRSRN
jgi:hypothetical protein